MALWTPVDLATEAKAWYDASDASTITESGGAVSQWDDKTSNGRDLVQATGSEQPTIASDTISFDGTDDYLENSSPFMYANGEIDVYIVGAVPDTLAIQNILGESEASASPVPQYRFTTSTATGTGTDTMAAVIKNDAGDDIITAENGISSAGAFDDTKKLYMYRDDGSNLIGYVNAVSGTNRAYTRSGSITPHTFTIVGMYRDGAIRNPANADINEIVITSNLSTTERQKMEGYLAWKWGIQSSLPAGHPYKNAAPCTGTINLRGNLKSNLLGGFQ